jgi:UDP-N-acetylmuramoyl-L-alanyl-D-glutamate--2,6-diaminopimelate ligase
MTMKYRTQRIKVATPLVGRHNIMNCLAAAGACASLGVDLPTIASALENFGNVPGRMERVPADAPFQVFVDYAHTDDAMEKVLDAVRPLTKKRVIVVFGCGGDRDRTKRPRMAKVAEKFADCIVVTSDNPRSENPDAIIEEIVAGFSDDGRQRSRVEPDRRRAIELAMGEAREGDVVVIAGKGHEKYQIVGSTRSHFDDVEVAREILQRRGAAV